MRTQDWILGTHVKSGEGGVCVVHNYLLSQLAAILGSSAAPSCKRIIPAGLLTVYTPSWMGAEGHKTHLSCLPPAVCYAALVARDLGRGARVDRQGSPRGKGPHPCGYRKPSSLPGKDLPGVAY